MTKAVRSALASLADEGYKIIEPAKYRNPWSSGPVLCAVLRSPKGDEEVATFSTADRNALLGIYPRSLTNL